MPIESVFKAEQAVPAKYTCNGGDISPLLKFLQVPQGTKSLELINGCLPAM